MLSTSLGSGSRQGKKEEGFMRKTEIVNIAQYLQSSVYLRLGQHSEASCQIDKKKQKAQTIPYSWKHSGEKRFSKVPPINVINIVNDCLTSSFSTFYMVL